MVSEESATKPIFVTVRREFADEVSALAPLVDADLIVMTHDPDWCACDGTRRLTAACVRLTAAGNAMTCHAERSADVKGLP